MLCGCGLKKKPNLGGESGHFSNHDYKPSGPDSKDVYKRDLEERRNAEQIRQAQIKARAQNIAEIMKEREKGDDARKERQRDIEKEKENNIKRIKRRIEFLNREYIDLKRYSPDDPKIKKIYDEINELKKML